MSDTEISAIEQLFGNFQYEIYARGLAGETPGGPLTASGLERAAEEVLSAEAFGYVAGGAGAELTMRANLAALERVEIVPRMLRDVAVRDLRSSVLGTAMAAPVMLAPVGVQSIVHPEAELAVGSRGGGAGPSVHPQHGRLELDRGRRRGGGRGGALVPAVLAQGPRPGGELPGARGTLGLRGDRGHARHLDARLASARPAARLPAVPERGGRGELPQRPGVPLAPGAPAGGGPGGGDRPVGGAVLQPGRDVGRPGVAARADRSADRAEGDRPRRRRAPRGRGGDGRGDRVQSRRAPGRRRDRGARCPAGGARGGGR